MKVCGKRVVQLAAHFNVPAMVSVNKFDLNPDETSAIEDLARSKNLKVLSRIPFDPIFTHSMVQGQNLFEYDKDSEPGRAIKKIWGSLSDALGIN